MRITGEFEGYASLVKQIVGTENLLLEIDIFKQQAFEQGLHDGIRRFIRERRACPETSSPGITPINTGAVEITIQTSMLGRITVPQIEGISGEDILEDFRLQVSITGETEDCGSEKSLISNEFFNSLPINYKNSLRPTTIVIKSLSGHFLPVQGVAKLFVTNPGSNKKVSLFWDFIIVENLPFSVILGFFLMERLDCSLHFRKRKLEFGYAPQKEQISDSSCAYGSVVVRTDVTIDPGTFRNVDCKLIYGDEIKIEDGDNLIVTPLEGYENYLHDYVSTVYDQKTRILIFNDSCMPIELKHYTEITSFSRFPKETLVAFSKSLGCNGSMIEEKEVEWDSKEYLSQFDFSSVPNVVQLELEALLLNSKSCFSLHPYDVGKNDLMIFKPDMPIDTEFKPPKQFRIPYQMALVLEEHIQAMLQSGTIKEESSQFPSLVFLIRKHRANKNEQLSKENTRFLIDLRTCNTKMKDTAFLIPRTTDILQNLSKGKFYSEFDMRSGFFQISIDENYQKFFSFLSPLTGRSHCYTRIPQGSVFGPKAFANFMDKLFPAKFRSFVFNFFDDIYLKTENPNPKDHLEHLKSFTIVHGLSGKSLADLQFNKPTNLNYFDGYDSYVTRLIQNICEIHQMCLNEIKIQRFKLAIQYNKGSKETLIASGDIAYCRDTTSVGRKSTNYSFRGPYVVLSEVHKNVFYLASLNPAKLCRAEIRKSIGASDLNRALKELPLPYSLRKYLAYLKTNIHEFLADIVKIKFETAIESQSYPCT
ncbi:hypothetical protein QYM36_002225 [Artemia franciscana]|uniref:Reverse transcriptase domain-containing protein n=1 Tax=Artemia franciscana TaxID=6661 RepID=A0AA88LGX8_ARTSF|nr:hypothetical protein QYM36_002225 [Artemia franciscana]